VRPAHQQSCPEDVEVAEVEDMGMVFQVVVYAITAEQWRSGAAARRRGVR